VPISKNNASFEKEMDNDREKSEDEYAAPINTKLAFFDNLEQQQRKEAKRKLQKAKMES